MQKDMDYFSEQALKLMLIECNSFYTIFKHIDEQYISKFHESAINNSLNEEIINNHSNYLFPYVINGAFAAELALKYIYANSKIDYPKGTNGHRLKVLYDGIMTSNKNCIQNDKEAIKKILFINGKQNEETVAHNLEVFDSCYNDFRYFFTTDKLVGINNFFSFFVNSVCSYVLNNKQGLFNFFEDV